MRLSLSALFFGLLVAQGAMAAGDGTAAVATSQAGSAVATAYPRVVAAPEAFTEPRRTVH